MMRRRKVKISIVPHGADNVKVSRMFIVAIPVLFIILTAISAYLVITTVINFRNIKDYKSIKKLSKDVAILTVKERETKRYISDLEKNIELLNTQTTEIMPLYAYMSGIINTEEAPFECPDNVDSVLLVSGEMRQLYDSVYSILSNKSFAAKVPSMIPLSGWVLRPFGTVIDPYTETERINPGMLFVSEQGTEVYAAADGYVTFTGERKNLGKTVEIKHGKDYLTIYGHLSKILTTSGRSIKKGDVIGYVGNTGKTLSPSLYYEIRRNEKSINPASSFMLPVYSFYDTLLTNI